MPDIALVAPGYWKPLAEALPGYGVGVHHIWANRVGRNDDLRNAVQAAALELKKGLLCSDAPPEALEHLDRLASNLEIGIAITDRLEELLPDAVVVTHTGDPLGRIAVEYAKRLGIPSIHVQHACVTDPPEDAWFDRESPGDYVLAAGERDREWWRRCNPDANVTVTGHPLWDHLATLEWQPTDPPLVVWLAQSDQPLRDQMQTRDYWRSRAVPQRAWQGFLQAVRALPDLRFLVKLRQGEHGPVVDQWRADADGVPITFSDEPLAKVLPEAALVIGQDSNGLVEALHLGIPVISLTRPGSELFRNDFVTVLFVEDWFADRLAVAIRQAVPSPPLPQLATTRRETALRFNLGAADGKSMERVCQKIAEIASKRC